MRTSAADRDEWRYYPEGPALRSATHVAKMDFMRIDFYDEFVMHSPTGAHDQFDGASRKWVDEAGLFSPEAVFIDYCRRISPIIGHQTLPPGVATSTGR
ncbi:hypothetical protein [Burkholderia seminalis]|uniref:hypothetical protein n=1 Tax=Burkholderia seminalis TaxID=488731 RepID=UPI00159F0404|nr:hypothetical protein [Burkholderia seminalis]